MNQPQSGKFVTTIVFAILVLSVVAASFIGSKNRKIRNAGQLPAVTPRFTPTPRPETIHSPYYVTVAMDRRFRKELKFSADGAQSISYVTKESKWLLDIETTKKTDSSVEITFRANQIHRTTNEGKGEIIFKEILTLDKSSVSFPPERSFRLGQHPFPSHQISLRQNSSRVAEPAHLTRR